jgi:hypothetical protein
MAPECLNLCHAWGIQAIAVAHRITNVGAVGEGDRGFARILEGLISDADVLVFFAQPYDQLDLIVSKEGRSRTEAELRKRSPTTTKPASTAPEFATRPPWTT